MLVSALGSAEEIVHLPVLCAVLSVRHRGIDTCCEPRT